jgi:hypothetical protein
MLADRNGDFANSFSLNFSSEHGTTILRFQLSKSYTLIGYFIYLAFIVQRTVFWYVSARYMVTALLVLNGVSPFN